MTSNKISGSTVNEQDQLLRYAELLFKMAFAIHSFNRPEFQYIDIFAWGKHAAKKKDLRLTKREEELFIPLLRHITTYILATQIDTCLEKCFGKDRRKHKDKNIASASRIAYFIRNSFTHNPFHPTWLFGRRYKGEVLNVENIIQLDTNGLEGKFVDRFDYGGPLALLSLSKYVRKIINKIKF